MDVKQKLKKLKYFKLYDNTKGILKKNPKYPLYYSDYNNFQPFFIVGSGRSGNTLLRSMLIHAQGVVIPPESYVLGSTIRKYYNFSHQDKINWNELCALVLACFDSHEDFKYWNVQLQPIYERLKHIGEEKKNLAYILEQLYKEYAIQNNLEISIWGDKTPLNTFHLNSIIEIFPNAKFIHTVRDGRDVASSYVRARLYNSLKDACKRWNKSISHIQEFSSNISKEQILTIKYEDLVNETEKSLKGISSFLGIEYNQNMITRPTNKHLGDVDSLAHHNNVKKNINSSSIGKWKTNLSREEKIIVNKLCYKNLKKLNYLD
ncbi:sulfotransferase family protein [Gracilibacillus massiliensis]|uniref:sulfotransferase family protein n=1 Tax=Gracilibacillus massiliensis TaxID=1564956 RepID=UPI00071DEB86|nr:sulfotransferase [Gracilibacillus massiliensis]